MKRFILLLAIAGLLVSCSSVDEEEKTVLARVNDEVLTLEELMYHLPPDFEYQIRKEEIDDAVESWINTEVLYQSGAERGLESDPEVRAVIKIGIKETVAKKLIEKELTDNIVIPAAIVDSIYAARRDSFKLVEDRFRASHILLETEGEARAILNRLEKGGDFAELARDYSRDRLSAKIGGDIGYFGPGQIDNAIIEAAGKLKVGSYSGPVRTPYGFHIIMLTDRRKAGSVLDSLDAKKQIHEELFASRHSRAFGSMLDSLRALARIERYPLPDLNTKSLPGSN